MKFLTAILLAFFLLVLPLAVHAQESAPEAAMSEAVNEAVHEEVVQQEDGHHEGGGGLPQFNVATWPSQIFWMLVTFTLLYAFYSKAILPSLGGTIQKRTDKIQGDIITAEALSAKAEEIRSGYESELKKASGKASSDMKAIEEAAKAKLAQSLADFRTRYEAETSAVETRLEQSKQAALGDMQKLAAEIAAQAAEKIAGIPADRNQAESVVQSLKNKAA